MAVTVKVDVPGEVVAPAASVIVQLPFPGDGMLEGEKVAVIPLGTPLTDKAIAEVNPVAPESVTVIGSEPPRATLALAPLRVNVKLGAGVTVRLRV